MLLYLQEGECSYKCLAGQFYRSIHASSACTSASLEPSYVLRAIGADEDLAHSSIRYKYLVQCHVYTVVLMCMHVGLDLVLVASLLMRKWTTLSNTVSEVLTVSVR